MARRVDEESGTQDITAIDLGLARIVSGEESLLGINQITVESDPATLPTVSFEDNGLALDFMTDELLPTDYHQSTPSARGQFAEFVPPGNLITACLSGSFPSTTGETFVGGKRTGQTRHI